MKQSTHNGTPGGPARARHLVAAAGVALALAVVPTGPAAAETGKRQAFRATSTTGSYLAGRHAERVFALSDAATLYARALAEQPGDLPLLTRTLFMMVASGRTEAAVPLARRLVKARPESRLGNLVLAAQAAKRGRAKVAEEHLRPLPAQGTNRVLLPLLRAWISFGAGRRDLALKGVREVQDVRGFENFYYLHSGLMLELAGRAKAAGERYQRAFKSKDGPGLRLVYATGQFYERAGRRKDAVALYLKYLKRSPDSLSTQLALQRARSGRRPPPFARSATDGMAEALFDIASAVRRGRRERQALIYARLALYMRPRFAPALLLIANILDRRGRRADAVALYRSVPKDSPLAWTARLAAAHALNDLKRLDEAIPILERMARERPKRHDALVALGDVLSGNKRFKEAAKAYDRAIARIGEIQKRHAAILYARGIALERSKQWVRAEKDFLKALEFNPNQPLVLNYLGYSWVERGRNLDRARKMIEKAVSLRKNDGYIVDSLGWVLFRIGKYKEAVKHLERAVELRPQDPTINDHLGDAYWMVGRTHEAEFQWRRALSLEPEKDQIKVIQAKIAKGLDKKGKKPGRSH